ncbi:MAG: AI-2E family transporter [Planctomycetota bacterium]|jgi:predicted PurR-regulated permease PerM
MAEDIPAAPASPPGSRRQLRIAVFAALAVGTLLFIWALGDIFAPVFAALALAYMLDPFVKRLEGRGWPRRRAVLAIFAAAIFLMVAMLAASVPFIVRDVSYAVSAAKTRLEQAGADDEGAASGEAGADDKGAASGDAAADDKGAASGEAGADDKGAASGDAGTDDAGADDGLDGKLMRKLRQSETMRKVLDWARDKRITDRAFVWLQENARLVAEQTLSAARGGIAMLFRLGWLGFMVLLFPVYLYFFMVGLGELKDKAFAVVPPGLRPKVERMAHEFGVALSGFFRGRLVVALAIGLFTAVLFAAAGLRFGVLLGLAIGVASLIPFVNIVFLIPAVVIALVQFESLWMMTLVFGIYALGQCLDPLLTPFLVSKGTGLHPVTIIVSLLVWGRLLGVVGLLIAVPLTAALKITGREVLLPVLVGNGSGASGPEVDQALGSGPGPSGPDVGPTLRGGQAPADAEDGA